MPTRRMLPWLLLLGCAGLGKSARAQSSLQFDLIAYDEVVVPGGPNTGCVTTGVLLVNTGSVSIDMQDWGQQTLLFAGSPVPLEALYVYAANPIGTPGQSTLLQPGQAIGNTDPLLTAWLQASESLYLPYSVGIAGIQIEGGPLNTTQDLKLAFQLGGMRAAFGLRVHFSSVTACSGLRATRFTAVPSDSLYDSVGPSCSLPGTTLSLVTSSAPDTGNVTVSPDSTLPVIGNSVFRVVLKGDLDAEIGRPYVFALGQPSAPVALLGCDVWVDLASPLFVVAGTVQPFCPHPPFCVAAAPLLELPIPGDPSLVGALVAAQAAVITPHATNGLLAASDGVHILVGQLP